MSVFIFMCGVVFLGASVFALDFLDLCVSGTPEEVKKAIEAGVDVNARDERDYTPLMWAVRYNPNSEVTKILIDAGADVNAKGERGYTPLMWAVRYDKASPEIVKLLLDAGADVNAVSQFCETALDQTIDEQKVELLIKRGAKKGQEICFGKPYGEVLSIISSGKARDYGFTPLTVAIISNDDLKEVKEALAKTKDLNTRDMCEGHTPLIWAILLNRSPQIVKLLLDAGADVNAEDYSFGMTPLGLAILNRNYETIDLLLKAGAKPSLDYVALTSTPLREAISIRNAKLVKLLLEKGADANELSSEGYTVPLCTAVETEDLEIVRILLDAGADVNMKIKAKAGTPFVVAVSESNLEIVKLLLDAGADVNVKGYFGWTPLMWAVRYNPNSEVTKILIDAGADVNAKDDNGWTPLMWAARAGREKAIKLLLSAGADPLITNNEGKRAIDYTEEGTENYNLLAAAAREKLIPSQIVFEGKGNSYTCCNGCWKGKTRFGGLNVVSYNRDSMVLLTAIKGANLLSQPGTKVKLTGKRWIPDIPQNHTDQSYWEEKESTIIEGSLANGELCNNGYCLALEGNQVRVKLSRKVSEAFKAVPWKEVSLTVYDKDGKEIGGYKFKPVEPGKFSCGKDKKDIVYEGFPEGGGIFPRVIANFGQCVWWAARRRYEETGKLVSDGALYPSAEYKTQGLQKITPQYKPQKGDIIIADDGKKSGHWAFIEEVKDYRNPSNGKSYKQLRISQFNFEVNNGYTETYSEVIIYLRTDLPNTPVAFTSNLGANPQYYFKGHTWYCITSQEMR